MEGGRRLLPLDSSKRIGCFCSALSGLVIIFVVQIVDRSVLVRVEGREHALAGGVEFVEREISIFVCVKHGKPEICLVDLAFALCLKLLEQAGFLLGNIFFRLDISVSVGIASEIAVRAL